MQEVVEAVVIKNAGSYYMLSQLPKWEPFPAVLKGKIRLKGCEATNPIAVGDKVICEIVDPQNLNLDNPAVIKEILDRKNYLIRKSTNLSKQAHIIAANVDMVFIIVTLYFPEIKLPLLDRILVTCKAYNVDATIVLNKIDLYKEQAKDYFEYFCDIYTKAGYKIIQTSTVTQEGIDTLKKECEHKVCIFSGESGVGKSSLINCLDSNIGAKTGDISQTHLAGKHTTSLYEMYPLSNDTYIIDTPGIRGFGLMNFNKEEIYLYFPEMLKESENCKFSPCTHTHEPQCAVIKAVEEGRISPERYNSYLGMLKEDTKFR